MTATAGSGWFVCWWEGCPQQGRPQYVRHPMTGREAFDRHYRTNHTGRPQ